MFINESLNELKSQFQQRVEDLLENTEGIQDTTPETLARWITDEFGKFLVELDETDSPCVDDPDFEQN